MRAFYKVPVAVWDGPEQRPDDCVEVSRTTTTVFVLAPENPHPALDALGAALLGARLSELDDTVAKRFTNTLIEQDGEVSLVPSTAVPKSATLAALVVDGTMEPAPPVLRVIFAGDEEADLL